MKNKEKNQAHEELGDVSSQKWRKIVIFIVSLFGVFLLPGVPTQSQAPYLCKKIEGAHARFAPEFE